MSQTKHCIEVAELRSLRNWDSVKNKSLILHKNLSKITIPKLCKLNAQVVKSQNLLRVCIVHIRKLRFNWDPTSSLPKFSDLSPIFSILEAINVQAGLHSACLHMINSFCRDHVSQCRSGSSRNEKWGEQLSLFPSLNKTCYTGQH